MNTDYVFEIYPDEIQARLEARDRFARSLPTDVGGRGLEFVIETLKRWEPGQTLTVAFKGGTTALHQRIADVAAEWTRHGNLHFDFGFDAQGDGQFRRWSSSDQAYAAHIRISFDQAGRWSLVGTDSVSPQIVDPGQASMNFGGWDQALPGDADATILHEFGHALGFQHEHQHPAGGCDLDFRWEDDPGYTPTTDNSGQFVVDSQGRRPGIYTVLGGAPNRWPKAKVDHNLRQLGNSHAFMISAFDPHSIMKYFFGEWMFRDGAKSHCFSQRNATLSETDRLGMRSAYPDGQDQVNEALAQRRSFLDSLINVETIQPGLKRTLEIQREGLDQR
ncbi:MAG TPA: hypothetical protein VF584_24070 [Longimicrobium sp.]